MVREKHGALGGSFSVEQLLLALSSYYQHSGRKDLPFNVVLRTDVGEVRGDMSGSAGLIVSLVDLLLQELPAGRVPRLEISPRRFFTAISRNPYRVPPGYYVEFVLAASQKGAAHRLEYFADEREASKELQRASRYLKKHGGGLVASVSERGTTYRFLLPAVDTDSVAESEDATQGAGTIMVVDNDEDVLQLVESGLKMKGYTVIAVRDGSAAMEKLQDDSQDICLVLSDAVLPQIDGATLVKNACVLKPGLKVILTSTSTDPDAIDCLKDVEYGAFISKPYPLPDLFSLIDSMLRYH